MFTPSGYAQSFLWSQGRDRSPVLPGWGFLGLGVGRDVSLPSESSDPSLLVSFWGNRCPLTQLSEPPLVG